MNIYNLKTNLDSKIYYSLFKVALLFNSNMLFVLKDSMNLSNDLSTILNESQRIFKRRTKRWPGTVSLKESVDLYSFKTNEHLMNNIKTLIPSLWDWLLPNFPEDLCFTRPNGQPWFISITHEKDCYFILNDNERKIIENHIGEGLLVFFKEQLENQEIYI